MTIFIATGVHEVAVELFLFAGISVQVKKWRERDKKRKTTSPTGKVKAVQAIEIERIQPCVLFV